MPTKNPQTHFNLIQTHPTHKISQNATTMLGLWPNNSGRLLHIQKPTTNIQIIYKKRFNCTSKDVVYILKYTTYNRSYIGTTKALNSTFIQKQHKILENRIFLFLHNISTHEAEVDSRLCQNSKSCLPLYTKKKKIYNSSQRWTNHNATQTNTEHIYACI